MATRSETKRRSISDPNPALVSIPTSLQCIGMTPADVSAAGGSAFKSMRALVHERLISINDALLNDQAISATDKAFINLTSVPVYKIGRQQCGDQERPRHRDDQQQ